MTYAALAKLKKNSVSTTLSSGINDTDATIPVSELSVFYDADAALITKGIVIGYNDATETLTEEITITGASGASGAGNLTGATRGVKKDGTIGEAVAWSGGTKIAVMISTGIYDQICDNIAAHESAKAPANPLATDTLWDAKGDLAVGTGADTAQKLTVGANGKMLVAASGETTGLNWIFAKRTYHLSCAGGWNPTTAPAGAFTTTETSTNKVNFKGTLFAAGASDIFHEFGGIMPKNWDGGTVTAFPVIFVPTSTDASDHTIKLSLAIRAYASGDAGDQAYGTKQESTITAAASLAGKVVMGAATSAITVAGSPAGNQHLQFRVGRTGDDTYTGDIVVLEWVITYTTNNASDE